jgi:hypothetical protein
MTVEDLARRLHASQAENATLRQMLFQSDTAVASCRDFVEKTQRKVAHIEAYSASQTRKITELEAREAFLLELLADAVGPVSDTFGPRHFKVARIQSALEGARQ